MREVAFIKQNKGKWLDFERAIFKNQINDPDDLAAQYIQLINDLSYAQTYYPKSKLIAYLNQLATAAFQKIYRTKRQDQNRLIYFWKTEAPLIIYQYRKFLIYSFAVFFCFVGIGVLSAANDQSFIRLILGDQYVNTTLSNIQSGDPVAIYKSGSNWGSFIGITINNLYVSMQCFITGVFAGIGTVWILLQNGIMLGAFQYMFYQQGVFWESVQGIWIHGAMEIFSIVISAMAGLVLGSSILFPKTYSRLHSFKRGMKDGLKILLSTFPFFIAAGFLEGFVTRYSNVMTTSLSMGIILITLAVISFYYLIYPFRVYKKNRSQHATL